MHSLSKLTVKATGDGRLIVAFYALTVVLVSILKLTLTEGAFNNFDIFRYSFLHLLEGKDLYAAYPEVYFDLYKYSPGFSLFMAPFWYLERTSALVLWNLLNAVFPVYILGRMNFSVRERWFFALFILFEMITSIQNAQSNGLMLALMMWAFDARENNNIRVFALAVALGVSIKLFAAVVVLLLFFQDNKTKWLIYSAVSGVVLLLLPAFITGFQPLWQLYISWFNLLINDAPH
ncbi:MAG TPA: glycosyltransferase family 87 protein, partial [Bacteroidales bacterium]|nr:glycosyltransferase family 87 protein [Bacteroidales bacterium]